MKNREPACNTDDKEGLVGSLFSCCYLSRVNRALINQKRKRSGIWNIVIKSDTRQDPVIFHQISSISFSFDISDYLSGKQNDAWKSGSYFFLLHVAK